jgi:hypothetical protein
MLAPLVLCLWIAQVDPRPGPPSADDLAKITARGRLLAGYDNAAWHGSDAVVALKPEEGKVERYIARKGDKGWVVSFGKLNVARDKYLVAYEAVEGDAPDKFSARAIDPPREEAGFELKAALAIDAASADFLKKPPARRRYNVAAISSDDGKTFVYLFPAPLKAGVWPLGGDVRYLIAADGKTILEKRPLHKAIIELERPNDAPDSKLAMGTHNHILDVVPEDTDVFHVLARKPSVPEMIATERFVYVVEKDGAIKYLGKTEDVLKK